MANRGSSRREFLRDGVGDRFGGGVPAFGPVARAASGKLHVACNQYPWGVFYAREKKDFNALLDAGLAEVKASGNDGFEPGWGACSRSSR